MSEKWDPDQYGAEESKESSSKRKRKSKVPEAEKNNLGLFKEQQEANVPGATEARETG